MAAERRKSRTTKTASELAEAVSEQLIDLNLDTESQNKIESMVFDALSKKDKEIAHLRGKLRSARRKSRSQTEGAPTPPSKSDGSSPSIQSKKARLKRSTSLIERPKEPPKPDRERARVSSPPRQLAVPKSAAQVLKETRRRHSRSPDTSGADTPPSMGFTTSESSALSRVSLQLGLSVTTSPVVSTATTDAMSPPTMAQISKLSADDEKKTAVDPPPSTMLEHDPSPPPPDPSSIASSMPSQSESSIFLPTVVQELPDIAVIAALTAGNLSPDESDDIIGGGVRPRRGRAQTFGSSTQPTLGHRRSASMYDGRRSKRMLALRTARSLLEGAGDGSRELPSLFDRGSGSVSDPHGGSSLLHHTLTDDMITLSQQKILEQRVESLKSELANLKDEMRVTKIELNQSKEQLEYERREWVRERELYFGSLFDQCKSYESWLVEMSRERMILKEEIKTTAEMNERERKNEEEQQHEQQQQSSDKDTLIISVKEFERKKREIGSQMRLIDFDLDIGAQRIDDLESREGKIISDLIKTIRQEKAEIRSDMRKSLKDKRELLNNLKSLVKTMKKKSSASVMSGGSYGMISEEMMSKYEDDLQLLFDSDDQLDVALLNAANREEYLINLLTSKLGPSEFFGSGTGDGGKVTGKSGAPRSPRSGGQIRIDPPEDHDDGAAGDSSSSLSSSSESD